MQRFTGGMWLALGALVLLLGVVVAMKSQGTRGGVSERDATPAARLTQEQAMSAMYGATGRYCDKPLTYDGNGIWSCDGFLHYDETTGRGWHDVARPPTFTPEEYATVFGHPKD